MRFLSTLSLRRATEGRKTPECRQDHFYPRSPCGERHKFQDSGNGQNIISIHALLAESDGLKAIIFSFMQIFLSTLSLRRATGLDGRFKL